MVRRTIRDLTSLTATLGVAADGGAAADAGAGGDDPTTGS
jgi:hypothetical protein